MADNISFEMISNGGVQFVPPVTETQIVYLDFDGEITSYNGEYLTVENVEVTDSQLTSSRIATIVAGLNAKYASQNVVFVTEKPGNAEYSTIFIGKTSAFEEYGNFAGLAETIDEGNQIKNDNAFVMLDAAASDEAIISTISHETDHLLGTLDHGGNGLERYADAEIVVSSGSVASGLTVTANNIIITPHGLARDTVLGSGGSMSIMLDAAADNTIINSSGMMFVYSKGGANRTTINSGGSMLVYTDAVANSTYLSGGYMQTLADSIANQTTIDSGGSMYIYGIAGNTTVKSGGALYLIAGAAHCEELEIQDGATVFAYDGAQLDFTLNYRSASDGYLVNNLSLITDLGASFGNPWLTYTITVSATQASGTYKLAQGATNFNGNIYIGGFTNNYYRLNVNGSDITYNGVTYSLDQANGNLTLTVTGGSTAVSGLTANANGASWSGNGSAFAVEYSKDNFANVLQLETATSAVDTYQIGAGSWKVRVDSAAQTGFTATAPTGSAAQIVSDADGNLDLFFARTAGTWTSRHAARHAAPLNGWRGTNERVALTGKNIITDVFSGSTDANVLVLTDDSNGDALFLDDAFTALGNQARLSNIDEIRAGAGNDVIDLTSPKFAYLGDEMTVFGGAGDDTIWANSGENTLYGDAGNDRIIGGSGNDFIIGGAGNDALHGGGGSDTFCFGANWGTDTVEQLATGKVILRFESGSLANWNAAAKTYTNGANTVTVTGTNDIELYFGTASTLPEEAFAPAASSKIFEQLA